MKYFFSSAERTPQEGFKIAAWKLSFYYYYYYCISLHLGKIEVLTMNQIPFSSVHASPVRTAQIHSKATFGY